jgi:hypothetical protein
MVWVIIVFVAFTLIGSAIAWGASGRGFGRVTRPLQTESRVGRRFLNAGLVFVYVGFGIALPAILLIGNHDAASGHVGSVKLTADEKYGRILFGEHCAVCHTLNAASAVGKVGPNLDQLKPGYSLIMRTIQYGCLQNPGTDIYARCLGFGNMPPDVVQGRDARDVASFVSAVAGH